MNEETEWGFPKGRVAQTLKKILGRDLTQQQTDTFFVVLLSQLLVEDALNRILYLLMRYNLPLPPKSPSSDTNTQALEEMDSQLWTRISRMSFDNKLELLKPSLNNWYPDTINDIKDINTLRGQMVHFRNFNDLKFQGESVWEEAAIEKVFLKAQFATRQLDKFWEMIDGKHAAYESWAKRLKDLGEPLY